MFTVKCEMPDGAGRGAEDRICAGGCRRDVPGETILPDRRAFISGNSCVAASRTAFAARPRWSFLVNPTI
jgi:hypothetical protein